MREDETMNEQLRTEGALPEDAGTVDDVPKPELVMPTARILEPSVVRQLIRQRQKCGIDKWDEVWEGVYVVPPLANNPHQNVVGLLTGILFNVVILEERGQVQPGANVSDRRDGWEHNYRDPDVVVVLNDGQAIDCGTHWMGGPDFLVEIQSPGDETEEKIPFYSKLGARELLIIYRDTRHLRLLRHNGKRLVAVKASALAGGKWLVSEVVPLAFRQAGSKAKPRTEVRRTDDKPGSWTV
jgi:Uma2 family endonuclease